MSLLDALLLCIFFLAFAILNSRKQHKKLPPGPPVSLPIIGHLYLLKKPIHRTFHDLSHKYGPIISLRLGRRLVIVVSSHSAAEECFSRNDVVFANRPLSLAGKHVNYNNTTLGAASYGDHWRNLRRLSVSEIFSSNRLNAFSDIRRDEVKMLLRRLYRVAGNDFAKVELRSMLMDLTSNVVMRMVAGKQYYGEEVSEGEEARRFREIVTEIFGCSENTNLCDLFPVLEWIDFGGDVKRVVRAGKKADEFLQELVDEHRIDLEHRNTMISHLLQLQESEPQYYTDEIIKGLILVMMLAGTETVATSLEWAISNLLNHPKVLEKATEELHTQIGQHHLMEESDYSNLHYLQSVINENLRLYPVAPLLLPHLSSEDCTVGGYHVPRGTMLFVNAWSIHRDPSVWEDPTRFKPERFEDGRGKAFSLLPFGMGRRACPGEGLGNRVMGLALGSLIQCFEWKRVGDEEIDMAEKTILSMTKMKPLEVMCKARPILHKFLS